MDNNINKNDILTEIDLMRIVKALLSKAWVLVISAVVCAVSAFVYTTNFVTPLFKSSALFYVNNSSVSVGSASLSISSSDIVASKNLVNTYIVILNSRACLNDVIDYANLDYTYGELKGMISAADVNETEVFKVEVTSANAEEAERIANAIAYILPKRISSIVEGTSAKIVDYAVVPSAPSSPSTSKNTLLGFVIGILLSAAVIVVIQVFDVTIRSEEDIERRCKYPILTAVPNLNSNKHKKKTRNDKYGYYSYLEKSIGSDATTVKMRKSNFVGKNISFAASEAYKLLRTKIQFSFVDEELTCPVIGVSSAMAGEGKSLSSSNIAYTLAQLEKKVLLIDCDMRRPSLSTKLPIQKTPGLSNYLIGQIGMDTLVQTCKLDTQEGFDVIASGRNPPNPVELLSSTKMEKMINLLRKYYDYIILDLPPVGEVSDALVLTKLIDGMILVVRQDYCNGIVLSNVVKQFEFVDSKILGIVMNCASESIGRYGYDKKYYGKYAAYSEPAKRTRKRKKLF